MTSMSTFPRANVAWGLTKVQLYDQPFMEKLADMVSVEKAGGQEVSKHALCNHTR